MKERLRGAQASKAWRFPEKPFACAALSLSILCAAACLGGCSFSPPPVLQYSTADSADLWQQGQRLHSTRIPSFSFTTSFLEYSYETVPGQNGARPIIFRVAVRNSGSSQALLDPSGFRLVPTDTGRSLSAIDPETVLLAAERGRRTENASHAGDLGTQALIDVPMIILDAASHLSGATTPQMERDRCDQEAERRQRAADAEARHERALKEWDGVRTEWSVNALYKTTLMPEMEVQGRVAFAVP